MTIEAIQGLFEKFGERIIAINLDNNACIFVNYPGGGVKFADIRFDNVGNTDFLVTKQYDKTRGGLVPFETYVEVMHIQRVVVADKPETWIDPKILK
jgi:hypothetical protein